MTNKIKQPIVIILFLVVIVSLIFWVYLTSEIFSSEEVSKSFTQFIALEGTDEYVLTELTTNEEFENSKFNYLFDLPIGDTVVKLSLVAHYKYFVKLAELKHHIEDGTVIIEVPRLYLSKPVAFEFSTVREENKKSLFGGDENEMLSQLKQDVSNKLINKGQMPRGLVYEKAAKALADNFNNYFKANGFGKYYKSIEVVFSSEKSQSKRQFNYNDSFCGNKPCLLELELGTGKILRIE